MSHAASTTSTGQGTWTCTADCLSDGFGLRCGNIYILVKQPRSEWQVAELAALPGCAAELEGAGI